jgi:putative chitinase
MTPKALIAMGVSPTQAKIFAEPLRLACIAFGIDSRVRQAAFLSQAGHESANFTRLEENLFYSTPERIRQVFPSRVKSMADAATLTRKPEALANRVYSDRLGNGDEASGDGWRFRGRGLFQLTGRANYRDAGYEDRPEAVAQPIDACRTAAWFFVARGCLPHADNSNIEAITRIVNGPAMLGLAERKQDFEEAMRGLL